jgi:hypothetical protein
LDEEDLPMLEQIVPMKNIKHGWANIAAWASVRSILIFSSSFPLGMIASHSVWSAAIIPQAAVAELGGEEVVSALRRTADAVSETVVSVAVPAWEATAEASEKLAEDLRPALENVRIPTNALPMHLAVYYLFIALKFQVAQNASSGWDCLTSACLHGSQQAVAMASPPLDQAAQGIAAGLGAISAAAAEELERLVHLAVETGEEEGGRKATAASAPMTV